jgi:hypothetical protein
MDEPTRTLIKAQVTRLLAAHQCPNQDHPNHCDCDGVLDAQAEAITEAFVTFTIFRELEQ